MLKFIMIVTLLVGDLQGTENAYSTYLHYRTLEQGLVTAELARAWGAPAAAGSRFLLMAPQGNNEVLLRFIQSDDKGNYAPMKTEGWNALEILVKDPDTLAARLEGSGFEVIGPPAYLTEKQNIRAFQALGPNRELIYFTRIIDPAKSQFNLGQAQTSVDRVFIMVAGGRDLEAMQRFYRDRLQQPVAGPFPYRISVLSRTYGKPADTRYPLALVSMAHPFLIELDRYPAAAVPRQHARDSLPPGIAMVSFGVDSLSPLQQHLVAPPAKIAAAPYGGARTGVLKGAAGEWIEVIELIPEPKKSAPDSLPGQNASRESPPG